MDKVEFCAVSLRSEAFKLVRIHGLHGAGKTVTERFKLLFLHTRLRPGSKILKSRLSSPCSPHSTSMRLLRVRTQAPGFLVNSLSIRFGSE